MRSNPNMIIILREYFIHVVLNFIRVELYFIQNVLLNEFLCKTIYFKRDKKILAYLINV